MGHINGYPSKGTNVPLRTLLLLNIIVRIPMVYLLAFLLLNILVRKQIYINKLLIKWKPNIQQICILVNELIELCRSYYTITYKITE